MTLRVRDQGKRSDEYMEGFRNGFEFAVRNLQHYMNKWMYEKHDFDPDFHRYNPPNEITELNNRIDLLEIRLEDLSSRVEVMYDV